MILATAQAPSLPVNRGSDTKWPTGPLHHDTLEAVGEALIQIDMDGCVKDWNQATETLLGYKAPSLYGQYAQKLFAPDEPLLLGAQTLQALLDTGHHHTEMRMVCADGAHFPAQVILSLIHDETQQPLGVLLACRDITLRMEAMRLSREASQRLSLHVQRTPLGFIEWDLHGDIISWNRAAERIFGWSAAEVLGKPYHMLVPDDLQTSISDVFSQLCNQTGGVRSTNNNLTREGRTIVCEWYNTALLDENHQAVGYASLVDDITDRVRMEEELRQSRLEAMEANRSKIEFLQVMNHEMRTPMNAIIGFTDLLLEDLRGSEQQQELEVIRSSAYQLLGLIDNVIQYSRLDSGKLYLELREMDSTALVHELDELFRDRAAQKGLQLRMERDEALPTYFFTDPTELFRMASNLIDNAIKFTDAGMVTARLTGQCAEDSSQLWNLRLIVEDTGCGIDPTLSSRLQEVFIQKSHARTRAHSGTGLGLAISRKIAELLSGSIELEPSESGGTRATCNFSLTAIHQDEKVLLDEDQDTAQSKAFFSAYYPLSLLVFTPMLQKFSALVGTLRTMGYQPVAVASMREYLEAIGANTFDAMLFDSSLSEAVLHTALRALHVQDDRRQRETRIALTAHTEAAKRAQYSPELKIHAVLRKPLRQSEVQQFLMQVHRYHYARETT